jgi:hypothetical protein
MQYLTAAPPTLTLPEHISNFILLLLEFVIGAPDVQLHVLRKPEAVIPRV